MGQSYSTLIQRCENDLKLAQERGNKQQEAQTYLELGNLHKLNRQFQPALECFEKALKIAKERKDGEQVKQVEQAYFELGNLHKLSRQFQPAIECFEKALKIAKERKDNEQVNRAYIELAHAYESADESQTGFEYFWKALEINAVTEYYKETSQFQKQEGDRIEKLSDTIETIFDTHDYSNSNNREEKVIETKKAIRIYKQAFIDVDETDQKTIKAKAFQYLGNVHAKDFEYKKAIEYYKKAREISPDLKADELEVEVYKWLGDMHLQVGHYQECIEYYSEVVKLASQLGDKRRKFNAYMGMGSAFSKTGDFKSSRKYYLEALTVAKQLNDKSFQSEAHVMLGHVNCQSGEFDAALKSYLKAQDIFLGKREKRSQSLSHWLAEEIYPVLHWSPREIQTEFHRQMSRDLCGRGVQRKFLNYLLPKDICLVLDSRKDEANIHFMLGNTFQQLKQEEKAIESYQQAINISKKLKDKELEWIAKQKVGSSCLTLALICIKDRDFEKAIIWYQKALDVFGSEPNNHLQRYEALSGLALAWFYRGDTEKAVESIKGAQKIAENETNTGGCDSKISKEHNSTQQKPWSS